MKRLIQRVRPPVAIFLIVGGAAVAGCGTGSTFQSDGTPARKAAATEAEALQRCDGMIPERRTECIAYVKQKFHDTSK